MPATIHRFPPPSDDAPLIALSGAAYTAMAFHMAADLLEADTFHDRKAAFLALVLKGYPSFYVALMIDDVRQLAMQAVVATEMSDG